MHRRGYEWCDGVDGDGGYGRVLRKEAKKSEEALDARAYLRGDDLERRGYDALLYRDLLELVP